MAVNATAIVEDVSRVVLAATNALGGGAPDAVVLRALRFSIMRELVRRAIAGSGLVDFPHEPVSRLPTATVAL
jgi:hypothetical protein